MRTSTGIRPHDTYGNFHLTLPNDIECAALNTSSSLVVDFKYDDKLPDDEHVIIQVAVLYTSLSGERRVRLHNLALAPCQVISDIYRNSCCDTIVNLIARNGNTLHLGWFDDCLPKRFVLYSCVQSSQRRQNYSTDEGGNHRSSH